MNAIARAGHSLAPSQLALIKRTVAKDCNDDEFNLFIEASKRLSLDPLRRQIYAFVFQKDKPEKRRLSIVVSIDGMRALAARSGDYRPDERAPRITIDPTAKDPATNPLGIVCAEVTVMRFSHGGWHPVTGVAYWEEHAPLKEIWEDKRPTGAFKLDTSGQWGRMPRIMIAKCAEAQALRKAWPEDLSNVYGEEELDQARVIDVTPAEQAAEALSSDRLDRIGGAHALMVAWTPADPIERVPLGTFADRVCAFLTDCSDGATLDSFKNRNRAALQEFWARSPGDALDLKKEIEKREAALKSLEVAA